MEKEHSELQKQIALEEKNFPVLTVPMVHFFLRKLKDGNVDDIKYRKTLINVFINKIYLYDDKLTIIFNSGDNPVTINDLLLSEIEDNSKKAEGLFLDGVAPPYCDHKKDIWSKKLEISGFFHAQTTKKAGEKP